MTGSLAVLSLAGLALVAWASSLVVAVSLPFLDRLARMLSPRQRVGLWTTVGLAPAVVAASCVLSSLLPAFGFGSDHCFADHCDHPHFCARHLSLAPGVVLNALAGLLILRVGFVLVGFARIVWVSRRTSRALAEAAERAGDVYLLPSSSPQAFLLGLLRPRVHASRALFAMDVRTIDAVLAHERAHANHHDLLWRALFPLLSSGHVPLIAMRLMQRLADAQELAADAEAADQVQDRLQVAEAILAFARVGGSIAPLSVPKESLGFGQADVRGRVHTLLAPPVAKVSWLLPATLAAATSAVLALTLAHDFVHHALETVLGALS